MKLTSEELKELRNLKNAVDSDDIRNKEIVKKKLLDNNKIIYLINNKELQEAEAEADEYYGVNIFPYYLIPETQYEVNNFICYETQFDEIDRYNQTVKYMQIIFYVLCEQKNLIEQNTYVARHDLLAALIIDEFNYTNYFGKKLRCISNKASVTDNKFACRTLIFEQATDNNLVKTKDSKARLINKDIYI